MLYSLVLILHVQSFPRVHVDVLVQAFLLLKGLIQIHPHFPQIHFQLILSLFSEDQFLLQSFPLHFQEVDFVVHFNHFLVFDSQNGVEFVDLLAEFFKPFAVIKNRVVHRVGFAIQDFIFIFKVSHLVQKLPLLFLHVFNFGHYLIIFLFQFGSGVCSFCCKHSYLVESFILFILVGLRDCLLVFLGLNFI